MSKLSHGNRASLMRVVHSNVAVAAALGLHGTFVFQTVRSVAPQRTVRNRSPIMRCVVVDPHLPNPDDSSPVIGVVDLEPGMRIAADHTSASDSEREFVPAPVGALLFRHDDAELGWSYVYERDEWVKDRSA